MNKSKRHALIASVGFMGLIFCLIGIGVEDVMWSITFGSLGISCFINLIIMMMVEGEPC